MGFLDTLFKSVQNAFGGVGNAVQGASKAIGGGLTGGAQAIGQNIGKSATSGALKQFAPQALKGMMPNAGRMGPQMKPMDIAMKSFAPMAGRMGAMSPGQTAPTGFSGGDSSPASKGFNLMDMFKGNAGKIAGGIGVTGLGHLLGGSQKTPDFNTQAMQNYQNYNTGKLPPNVEDMINRTAQINEDQATKQLRDVYKNARPGTDYTTDSAYQRDLANLQRTQTLNRADAQAQALMGFNQQELSRASELAQLSVAEIMYKTGMDAAEAQSIKEMFGNIGGAMVSSGLGLDQFQVGD